MPSKEKITQFRKGEIKLAQLFDVDSQQIAALLLLGYQLFEQDRLLEAKRLFEGLTVLDESNPYVHGMLGAVYQKEENYPMAVLRYTLALNLNPQDIASLTNRGEIYLKFGRFEEAAVDFQTAIALDPEREQDAANRARMLSAVAIEALKVANSDGAAGVRQLKTTIEHQSGIGAAR